MGMLMSSLLITFLVPLQVEGAKQDIAKINSYWIAEAVIDVAIIVGLPTYRNKVAFLNLNPELSLRESIKDDKPLTRRRQFVQNYVKNHTFIPSK
jgi:hypothetical protein